MSDLKSKPFWDLIKSIDNVEIRERVLLILPPSGFRAYVDLCKLSRASAEKQEEWRNSRSAFLNSMFPNNMASLKTAVTLSGNNQVWEVFKELYGRLMSENFDGETESPTEACKGCATGYGPHTHAAQSAEEPPPGSFSAMAQEHYERVTSLFVRQNQAVVESLQKDNLALRERLEQLEKQRWEDLKTLEDTLDAKKRLEEEQAAEAEDDGYEDDNAVALTLADAIADDARARLALAERDKLVAVTNAKRVDAQESLVVSLVPTIMPMLQPLLQAALRMGKPKPTDVDLAHLELLRAVLPTFDASQVTAVLSILTPSQIVALSEILELAAEKAGTAEKSKKPHEVPGQRTEIEPPATTAAEAEIEVAVDSVINFLGGEPGHGSPPAPWSFIRPELLLALEPANRKKLLGLWPVSSLRARITAVRDLFESIDVRGPEGERLAALTERHPELAKLFEPLVAAFWGKSKSD